jgi:hypothetical protein
LDVEAFLHCGGDAEQAGRFVGLRVKGPGAGAGALEVADDDSVNARVMLLGAGDVVIQEFQGTDLSAADEGGKVGSWEKGRVHGLILGATR